MIKVQSESGEHPVLLDTESSRTTVYRRYDVEEKQRENEDGSSQTYYTYAEEQWTKAEWRDAEKDTFDMDVDFRLTILELGVL